jgi:hypothetical protein
LISHKEARDAPHLGEVLEPDSFQIIPNFSRLRIKEKCRRMDAASSDSTKTSGLESVPVSEVVGVKAITRLNAIC